MKNKNINEQINRIKSLFNDERLYGNLSEQNTKFSLPTDEQLSKFLSDENRKKYINSSQFYKNYIEALDNWAKVSKDFGWTKSSNTVMSGEDFISTLSQGNTVDPNVCVNPTYFLQRQFEHIKEMSEMDFDGTKEFLGSIGIDSRILYEQNMTYTWDSDPKVSVDSKLSTGDFSSNYTLPSTTNDLGKYYTLKNDKKWEYKYYEDDNTWYTRKKGTNYN